MQNGSKPGVDDVKFSDSVELEVVHAFLRSLSALDADAAAGLVSEDFELAHPGLPTLRGRAAFRSLFGAATNVLTRFDIVGLDIAGNGEVVLTSRRELIAVGPFEVLTWACGTFHVENGLIVRLVDHFDFGNLLFAGLRGLVGLVVPPLRAGRAYR